MPLNKSFKVKGQQRSAIIAPNDFDEAVVSGGWAVLAVESLRLVGVDELQGPSPPGSFPAPLASRAMCSERSRHHSTCRGLAGREPEKFV